MKTKLSKIIILTLSSIFGLSLLGMFPSAYATDPCTSLPKDSPAYTAAGCDGSTKDALPQAIIGIINAIIALSGLIAVVFVIIGGINYTTSAGDAAKLEKAKKTILYACIGLAVTVLAFAIVNFAISDVIKK